ncbi:17 beta-hydroxysteroid dehydrogenase type 3, HSD17B3 [Handroanthus impetiginosus]|uniref:17 beta-hydroxysteroid dehydrogenase type 3, HSD17B3 n=1 Tax=Handroanthus impetiginosus TaxID=429701 RepID=A0A2G9HK03_9LAMI|nr:17 beta-hydroxysteroid dehydrogenase type 3, HSD17B3 [Handroanthus impetiginosus]PIN17763.1 17 beta-hydroxysteroid dehydrogenase type 3, HSD17B3 [Handroanthus impetiginosus]
MISTWIILVSILGFFILLKNFIFFLKWIFVILLRPSKDLKGIYGSWALITGSTDGIGKAFAFKLAKKGLNLVLVSRNSGKLKRVRDEIQDRYPDIKIRIFELDFSEDDVVSRVRVMEEMIEGLDIGVLINNVGVTYPGAMYFHEVDEKIWMNLVRVNVEGTSYVTKVVLKGMVARRRGAIVNMGSGASIVVPSHPLYAIYSATKGYVDQLSRSLYVEYKPYGIDVQCQVPLYVSTKMASQVAQVERSSIFIPTAEKYVEAAVGFIGYDQPRCTPYWAHSIQWFFASLLPDALLDEWRLSIGIRRMKLTT